MLPQANWAFIGWNVPLGHAPRNFCNWQKLRGWHANRIFTRWKPDPPAAAGTIHCQTEDRVTHISTGRCAAFVIQTPTV